MYLGYRVSQAGIETDTKKTEVIQKWPVPKTVTKVCSFLGFTNYYHWFAPQYLYKVRPLFTLLLDDSAIKKSLTAKLSEAWQQAFIKFKESTPILVYANKLPFKVYMDMCGAGLGAVHYQTQEGIDTVIGFVSHSLGELEQMYSAHKLNFWL